MSTSKIMIVDDVGVGSLSLACQDLQGKVRSMSWHHFQQFIVSDSDAAETTTVASDAVESSSPERSSACSDEVTATEEAKVIPQDRHLNPFQFQPSAHVAIPIPRTQTDGASGHDPKTCRPCVFAASRKGCTRTMCEFCHDHQHRCSGRRPRKETRERFKEVIESVPWTKMGRDMKVN